MSRIVTRDLAITDLLVTLSLHLPVLITVVCRGWVLGGVLCGITHYTHQLVVVNKLWLMVLVSGYRVWMVRQPASVRDIIQQKPWVKICAGVAAASCVVVVIVEGVSPGDNAFFDPRRLSCYGHNLYSQRALYSLLVLTPFYLTPIIMTIELLVQLLLIISIQARAARTRDSQFLNQRQSRRLLLGSVLRILVMVSHCLPVVSMFVDYVHHGRYQLGAISEQDYNRHNRVLHALGLTYVLLPLNCTSPLIYLAVNQQFRSYVSDISEETISRAQDAMGRVTRKSDFRFHFPFQRLANESTAASDNLQSSDVYSVTKL